MKARIVGLIFAIAILHALAFGQDKAPQAPQANPETAQVSAKDTSARAKMLDTILTTPVDRVVTVRLRDGKKLVGYITSVSKDSFKLRLRVTTLNPYTCFKNPDSNDEETINFDEFRSVRREPLVLKSGRTFASVFLMGAALPLTFLVSLAPE
jgi:hypothetical protein